MTSDPIIVASPLRSDGRWAALSALVVATLLVTESMCSHWLTVTHADRYYVDWNAGAMFAGWAGLCVIFTAAGLTFAMTVAARRSYLPVAPPLLIWIASAVGALGMLLVLRQAQHLDHLSRALDYYVGYGRDRDAVTVEVGNGLWLGLAGFIAATSASWRLWRIARRQRDESRTALAIIDAQIAAVSGDLVEEQEPIELVPSL